LMFPFTVPSMIAVPAPRVKSLDILALFSRMNCPVKARTLSPTSPPILTSPPATLTSFATFPLTIMEPPAAMIPPFMVPVTFISPPAAIRSPLIVPSTITEFPANKYHHLPLHLSGLRVCLLF